MCDQITGPASFVRFVGNISIGRDCPGAYVAFSVVVVGGVHFKLERTSCQQSLKYMSLYNTEGAPFST